MHPVFPMDDEGNIKIKPIGYVRSPIKMPQTGGLTDIETELVLSDDCGKCLDGIEEFSYVVVIYWLDRITSYGRSCHPQGVVGHSIPLGQLTWS